jgi:hypothetical protein
MALYSRDPGGGTIDAGDLTMFNPTGNTLPKCDWRDHDWKLLQYVVVVQLGPRAAELHQCSKCKRLRVVHMDRESA